MPNRKSGQSPFVFAHCEDLHRLPDSARPCEVNLHGGFAVDKRPGHGQVYYGMPGCGIMRISPDLTTQDILELPSDLQPVNFHSTKIGQFDGKTRLILPANNDAMVVIMTLEGDVDFILPKPAFDVYQNEENAFRPTDTTLVDHHLYVADGYGANYISRADLTKQAWVDRFGGKTDNIEEHGRFGTAHGLNRAPDGKHLSIADRPHSRFEIYTHKGKFTESYGIPPGSRPCGIDFIQHQGKWLAVVGSLDDPEKGRPAPIYILDGTTYEVLSTIRPKEHLGIDLADHIHNAIWHKHNGDLYLICQAWNPGYYFVLEHLA